MTPILAFLVLAPDPLARVFTPGERRILAAPDRVVLVQSSEPLCGLMPRRRPGYPAPTVVTRRLTGAKARAAVEALRTGLSLPASLAKCFNPRMRLTAYRGGASVSALICFECQQIAIDGQRGTVSFSPKSQPLFEALLK